jgi:hypothetical protein
MVISLNTKSGIGQIRVDGYTRDGISCLGGCVYGSMDIPEMGLVALGGGVNIHVPYLPVRSAVSQVI